jgi:uncharacterized OB-fold protein
VIPGVAVSLCEDCGWSGMPERLWCPVCRGQRVRGARVHAGAVEETTIVRKGVPTTVRLGTVRLVGGGALLARLEAGASEGGRVRLFDDGGAAVARPL